MSIHIQFTVKTFTGSCVAAVCLQRQLERIQSDWTATGSTWLDRSHNRLGRVLEHLHQLYRFLRQYVLLIAVVHIDFSVGDRTR